MGKVGNGSLLLVMKWLIPAGCLLLIMFRLLGHTTPGADAAYPEPPDEAERTYKDRPVWLCRRPVDDWRVQLLLPGAEHYSIWLPDKKLHRGVTANGLGQPLYWVDEIFFDPAGDRAWLGKGLICEPVPQANAACVERQVIRRRNEGIYSLTHHCQHIAIDVLKSCGGKIPPLTPFVPQY